MKGGEGRDMQVANGQISIEEMTKAREALARIGEIFSATVVGQDALYRALIVALMARGHVLLESVPGLAKTTAAVTLSKAISGAFSRIQCTPDLMPNDIVGTQIYTYETGTFSTQLGPVHANMVLLDEINRSSAKTQSAMLEAMQERQTSIGGTIYQLPDPFMVLATQNPVDEEGTYILPEAQMDRFLLKEVLTYPSPSEEIDILTKSAERDFGQSLAEPVTTDDVLFLQSIADRVYVDQSIKAYVVALINTTRGGGPRPIPDIVHHVRVGSSPRGSLALMRVGQAHALLSGRNYVVPDDIRVMRYSVLRHRLIRTYDALAAGIPAEHIIDDVFRAVPAP